jgi:hypothetical protein
MRKLQAWCVVGVLALLAGLVGWRCWLWATRSSRPGVPTHTVAIPRESNAQRGMALFARAGIDSSNNPIGDLTEAARLLPNDPRPLVLLGDILRPPEVEWLLCLPRTGVLTRNEGHSISRALGYYKMAEAVAPDDYVVEMRIADVTTGAERMAALKRAAEAMPTNPLPVLLQACPWREAEAHEKDVESASDDALAAVLQVVEDAPKGRCVRPFLAEPDWSALKLGVPRGTPMEGQKVHLTLQVDPPRDLGWEEYHHPSASHIWQWRDEDNLTYAQSLAWLVGSLGESAKRAAKRGDGQTVERVAACLDPMLRQFANSQPRSQAPPDRTLRVASGGYRRLADAYRELGDIKRADEWQARSEQLETLNDKRWYGQFDGADSESAALEHLRTVGLAWEDDPESH